MHLGSIRDERQVFDEPGFAKKVRDLNVAINRFGEISLEFLTEKQTNVGSVSNRIERRQVRRIGSVDAEVRVAGSFVKYVCRIRRKVAPQQFREEDSSAPAARDRVDQLTSHIRKRRILGTAVSPSSPLQLTR